MIRIHRSRAKKTMHVEVTIINAQDNRAVFTKIKKALTKMSRLYPISYVVTEVDFQE